ncbi:thioesterase II family protein [Catellatospora coxensis]|uniref:Oleoyl-ACP hydrolase n=1 Tax=Catellatospora coxensis TaxID=310354 RepID=A0A8J3KRG2_9ACTN|nr:alpha/beta fold hydrolase [Catellatospora coxensis]GIG04873.1 oleoyl-ACP hydrolase [Catellatospora coxensis]
MTVAQTPDAERWVRRFHPADGAPVRLVCFPHAGGSASFYFPVSRELAPAVDVLAVQYPGRQDRRAEPPLTSIEDLADRLAEVLAPGVDRPVVFFGHSMGAVVAFETALRFEAAGHPVRALVASGRRAPSRVRHENVHQRSDEGIVTELRLLSGTEGDLLGDDEVVRMILPALRADYQAVETYRCDPGRRITAPILALVGDADPRVDVAEVESWAGHTVGGFRLRVLPGGHFYLTGQQAAVLGELRTVTSVARSAVDTAA